MWRGHSLWGWSASLGRLHLHHPPSPEHFVHLIGVGSIQQQVSSPHSQSSPSPLSAHQSHPIQVTPTSAQVSLVVSDILRPSIRKEDRSNPIPHLAMPDQAEPNPALPRPNKPRQTLPHHAEPSHAKPSRASPRLAKPIHTEPCPTMPSRAKPRLASPCHA
jgi:hypothetical protein